MDPYTYYDDELKVPSQEQRDVSQTSTSFEKEEPIDLQTLCDGRDWNAEFQVRRFKIYEIFTCTGAYGSYEWKRSSFTR